MLSELLFIFGNHTYQSNESCGEKDICTSAQMCVSQYNNATKNLRLCLAIQMVGAVLVTFL